MNRAEFGIGCLTFAPVSGGALPDQSSRTRGAFWKQKIEEGLALLPSVTNLAVEIGSLYYRMPSRVDPLLNEEFDVFEEMPEAGSFVGFTITIPKRMHGQLVPRVRGSTFGCEQFQFVTVYCDKAGHIRSLHRRLWPGVRWLALNYSGAGIPRP